MQIKTTVKHDLTLVRMTIINKSTNNKLATIWRKGNPCALLVEMQIGAATVESSMEKPQKINSGIAL